MGILQPSLACLGRGGSGREARPRDLNPGLREHPGSTSLRGTEDEEADGSSCAPGNSLVLIQGTGKQLHRDSVSHRDVLVSWTSQQRGETPGRRKASSKCWRGTSEHPSLLYHPGVWLLLPAAGRKL